jgi:choline dehydrogenase-like flavoprotein
MGQAKGHLMSFFHSYREPDGREGISSRSRFILSIALTGIYGFLLEFAGTTLFRVYAYSSNVCFYVVILLFALGLGSVLVVLRRSHILVPMLMVGLTMVFASLFNHYFFIRWELTQGSFVDSGSLTARRIWEWTNGNLIGIRHPVLIAIVAGIFESLIVPASVWSQKLLTRKYIPKKTTTPDAYRELFANSVTPLTDVKPRRDLPFIFLRGFGLAFALYLAYLIIGLVVRAWDWPLVGMNTLNPAATINTFGKLVILLSLASIAAFNEVVRKDAVLLLVIAHCVAVAASFGLYLYTSPNTLFPSDHRFLLSSGIVDGLVLVALLVLYFTSGQATHALRPMDLQSAPSVLLKSLLLSFGVLYVLFTLGALFSRILARPDSILGAIFGGPDPLVINILAKYGSLCALTFFLYAKPHLRKYLMPTLTLALSVSVLATVTYGLRGSTVITTQAGADVTIPWFMMVQILVDGSGLIILFSLLRLQYHVDYRITSLRPRSAECVMSLHDSLRGPSGDSATAVAVLYRIDEQIVGIRGRRRGLLGFPFWLVEHVFPLLSGARVPFSLMSGSEQRWMLRRHVLRPRYERDISLIPELSDFMYQIGDAVHALVTLAYYTTGRAHSRVGYVLPDARERLQRELANERPPLKATPPPFPRNPTDPLNRKEPVSARLLAPAVSVPRGPNDLPDEVDYCIVGSGAAGGVLAYRLAMAEEGSSVCVLERGGYHSPTQDFSSDEMRMILTLYTDGGLQMTRSFDFTIAQGECVGGTTVINNAICLRMPEVSRSEWAQFGIDLTDLDEHYEKVKSEINIDVLQPEAVNAEVEDLFRRGVEGYNAAPEGFGTLSPAERLTGNFSNCLGCGLCNIGCKYLRKLSVLETYIPWAQAHGVQVFSGVGAVRCDTHGKYDHKRVSSIIVRNAGGSYSKIHVRKAVILAAGAIASSRFLMRSGVGGAYVGKALSCNFAFPVGVIFDQIIDAFDGLQITLSASPDNCEAIFETYFNPPGAYSISTAAHFDRHDQMMQAYRRSLNFGALVGSDPSGSVSRKRDLLSGRAIEWEQTDAEIGRIKRALSTIVRIAAAAGGRQVILPTQPPLFLTLDSGLDEHLSALDRTLASRKDFNFFTAHPQGGNLMAGETVAERVVSPNFRVRDCDNLFVCDASIFPRSIRVNPQWTIMALASIAADRITRRM